jgi:hypothetical protein
MCKILILPAALLTALLSAGAATADDQKDDKSQEGKKGTVVGVVTAKAENWIEVRADGEEKGRRYTPHWRGGLPKDGGGLDKPTLELIRKTAVGSRVRLEWSFHERPRIEKLEVLKKPGSNEKKEGDRP